MRRLIERFVGPGLVATGLLFWSGCAGSGSPTDRAGHDHDNRGHAHHGEHGHVHRPVDEDHDHDASARGHSHVGPDGGRLIVLGDDDYHAELVIDHAKGEVTVTILDRTARRPVSIDQREITLNFRCKGRPYQIRLTAVDSAIGRADSATCFTGTSDLLTGECQLTGRLSVVIGGKPYTGQVAHREGDHKMMR